MEHVKKNIVIISHYYPPHTGGIEIVASNHAKRLARLGNTVTVVTSKISSKEKDSIIDGVRVLRVKASNFFEQWGVPFPLFYPSLWSIQKSVIKHADIVHVHDAFYLSSFVGVLIAKIYKKPIVLTQHVALIAHTNPVVNLIQKVVYGTTGAFIFSNADKILTYNDRVRNFLLDRKVKEGKLISLINGVDTDLFRPLTHVEKEKARERFGFAPTENIILFVGRYVPKKGFDKVLALRNEKYKIMCVGGDTPKEKFENVVFFEKCDQTKLAEIYQIADLFVLPSVSEGFPLSIQEAMASGLPIVTVKDSGYEQYNLDTTLISLIDKSEVTLLKETVSTVIENSDLMKKMSEYSLNYARTYFDWSIVIEKLNTIYDSLVLSGKKEIAIVSDAVYPFSKGGKEKRLYDITTRLAKRGYDVTIYCMKWWEGNENTMMCEGVKFYAISPYYPLYENERRSIKQGVFFAIHCIKLIFKKFDVIEVDHIPHLVLFTTKLVCVLKRKQMIVTWHEVWGKKYWQIYLGGLKGYIAYMIEKITVTFPDIIVSVSEHTTANLKTILKVRTPIVTIPIGFEVENIKNAQASNIASDIIFAGRLLTHKNIDVLLKAIVILKQKNISTNTIIIGEGPEKENLTQLALNLDLKDDVSFFGFIEKHEDMYSILKSSKVFALPSTREGFGMVVIEANACGLPVLTTNHENNAAKDLIMNDNGTVFTLDENQLADIIEKTLKTRKDAHFYEQHALRYNWNNIFPQIEKLYS